MPPISFPALNKVGTSEKTNAPHLACVQRMSTLAES